MSLQETPLLEAEPRVIITGPVRGAWQLPLQFLAAMAIAGFVLCGAANFKTSLSSGISGEGSLGSTDAALGRILGAHGAAEQILNSLSGLPPRQPIAIITPPDDIFGSSLLQAIGSFTWPHEIYLVHVADTTMGNALTTLRGDHFGALLFHGIRPALPDGAVRHIGSLTVVLVPK